QSAHWLPVLNWFGGLWMVSVLPGPLGTGCVNLPRYRARTVVLLATFVGVAAASLVMPVIINDQVSIQSASLLDAGLSYPLHFRLGHIIVFGDLVFGALLA